MRVVLYDVSGVPFALPLERVREVVAAALPTPLPGAPSVVEGVLDVRGEVLPVVDLRARFGLPAEAIEPDQHLVIASRPGRVPVVLRVGRVGGVAELDEATITRAEALVRGEQRIAGVARLPDGVVLVQDLDRLLDEAEEAALAAALAAERR